MCNRSGLKFIEACLRDVEVRQRRILEVGSYDFNGSPRPLFMSLQPAEYIGVDMLMGPGVDLVGKAEELVDLFGEQSFDVVVTTEMMEHVRHWRPAVSHLKRVLRPGGFLILTTRSIGTPYHGYPYDFWRYEIDDLRAIFGDFEILKLERDPEAIGVFLLARRPAHFSERALDEIALFCILSRRRTIDILPAVEAVMPRFWAAQSRFRFRAVLGHVIVRSRMAVWARLPLSVRQMLKRAIFDKRKARRMHSLDTFYLDWYQHDGYQSPTLIAVSSPRPLSIISSSKAAWFGCGRGYEAQPERLSRLAPHWRSIWALGSCVTGTLITIDLLDARLFRGPFQNLAWTPTYVWRLPRPTLGVCLRCDGRTYHRIIGDSHRRSTRTLVEALMVLHGRETIDVLFIDGDHSEAGVRQDFELFSPLMREGGIVAFHDIASTERLHALNCYVDRLWQDIAGRAGWSTSELIKPISEVEGEPDYMGLGIATKLPGAPTERARSRMSRLRWSLYAAQHYLTIMPQYLIHRLGGAIKRLLGRPV
jgi:SAM-dependent methyltransferase